jgi:predicted metal-binding transcription factor (methanogenesis marker protein 9)
MYNPLEELRNIAEACLNDERIYDIINSISNMSEEELRDFRSKVINYFMNRNSPEDKEAYKFYKIVLEDKNAKKILELYEEIKTHM